MSVEGFSIDIIYPHEMFDQFVHIEQPFRGLDSGKTYMLDHVAIIAQSYEAFQGLDMVFVIVFPDFVAV